MNPAIKRLARELAEIKAEAEAEQTITAQPLGDDLFEWHFDFSGPEDSVYAAGRYHGRILFPAEYPFAPPSLSFLTPNGRWEVEKKICLSVTGYHPELWQPAWSSKIQLKGMNLIIPFVVRTILLALRDHMRVDDKAAIGYLDYSPQERRKLATASLKWKCSACSGGDAFVTEEKEQRERSSAQISVLAVVLGMMALFASYIYYHQ